MSIMQRIFHKQYGRVSMVVIAVLFMLLPIVMALSGCAAPVNGTAGTGIAPSAEQRFIKAATEATLLADQVALAATTAMRGGVLKGNDADNVIASVKAARDGIAVAKTLSATLGLSRLEMVTTALNAANSYILKTGATK